MNIKRFRTILGTMALLVVLASVVPLHAAQIAYDPATNAPGTIRGLTAFDDQSVVTGTATITIPATGVLPTNFVDIEVKCSGNLTEAGNSVTRQVFIQFNADAGANYDVQYFDVIGTSVTGAHQLAQSTGLFLTQFPANTIRTATAGSFTLHIPNYNNTTFEKNVNYLGGFSDSVAANGIAVSGDGSWRNTAAITTLKLSLGGTATFNTNTRCTSYGI